MARKRIITPEKKELIRNLISEYNITSAKDLQEALKDLLGDTIQICWKQSWMNISDMKSTNQLKKRNQITVTGTHQNIKVKCRASGNRYPAGPECRIRAENCSQV